MGKTAKEQVANEGARTAEKDEWLTPKQLAQRLPMSVSTIYSLIRRGSGIPYTPVSKGKILLNWRSVNKYLHEKETTKARKNFED
jgi:excisionase family DNA binding protein